MTGNFQHFRVKITFYLLQIQFPLFRSFLCLFVAVEKNYYQVDGATHLSYNRGSAVERRGGGGGGARRFYHLGRG